MAKLTECSLFGLLGAPAPAPVLVPAPALAPALALAPAAVAAAVAAAAPGS